MTSVTVPARKYNGGGVEVLFVKGGCREEEEMVMLSNGIPSAKYVKVSFGFHSF